MPIIPSRVEDISPTGDLRYLLAETQRPDALVRPLDASLSQLVEVARDWIKHTSARTLGDTMISWLTV